MKGSAAATIALFSIALTLPGCLQQEEDPCRYPGLPEGRTSPGDTLILRAILDSNGLYSVSANGVAWWNGKLDFAYRNLDSFYFPEIASQLQSIREVSFAHNRLKKIPRGISALRGVTRLYLWDNLIDSLPEELFSMTRLVRLYLDYNLLTSIPPGIANLKSLTYLNLSRNSLFSLPQEITRLSSALKRCHQPSIPVSGNYLCALPQDIAAFLDHYSERNWSRFQTCP